MSYFNPFSANENISVNHISSPDTITVESSISSKRSYSVMEDYDNNHSINNMNNMNNMNNIKRRKLNINETSEMIKKYKEENEKLNEENKKLENEKKLVVHKCVEIAKELKTVKTENEKLKSKMKSIEKKYKKAMEKEAIKWKKKFEIHTKNNAKLNHDIQVSKLKLHEKVDILQRELNELKQRNRNQTQIISNDCSKSEILGLFPLNNI